MIRREEHLKIFDGLPTRIKINKIRNGALGTTYKISPELEMKIIKDKQIFTMECINNRCLPDYTKIQIMQHLSNQKLKIGCCSNSIRATLELMLSKSGLIDFIDIIYSNEDVSKPKPNPEMYIKAMHDLGVSAEETLIVEDNENGKKAAHDSGAHVMEVNTTKEVCLDNLSKARAIADYKNLQIVIPMAGKGSRFSRVGYTLPKPLIPIDSIPMIGNVINNLTIPGIKPSWYFVCLDEHVKQNHIDKVLAEYCDHPHIIEQKDYLQGAACSVKLSFEHLDPDKPVMLANSDQLIDTDLLSFLASAIDCDGSILTFNSSHPKWSYAAIDDAGFVTEVKEKQPISQHATVGIYLWNKAQYLIDGINRMIEADDKYNNEFYVAPSYNYTIVDERRYAIHNIKSAQMHGIGTPEDLIKYVDSKG